MNTPIKTQTLEDIRIAGINILRQHLGIIGMIRFLQYQDRGHGDYSKERYEWLGEKTVRDIASEIKKNK